MWTTCSEPSRSSGFDNATIAWSSLTSIETTVVFGGMSLVSPASRSASVGPARSSSSVAVAIKGVMPTLRSAKPSFPSRTK